LYSSCWPSFAFASGPQKFGVIASLCCHWVWKAVFA